VTASVPEASNHGSEPQSSCYEAANAGRGARRSFPKSVRLLRHADFERVYKQGRRHFSTSMTVFYLPRADAERAPGLRVGFTVGRALGGAVERNRMKRRLREAVRLTRPGSTTDVDVVINPKKTLLGAEFEAVLNEVRRAFVVIEKNSRESRVASRETPKD